MRRLRIMIVAVIASASLAALTSTASANRLSITSRNIRVVWSSLEFAGGVTIRCRLTLEGSFHENTVAKTEGGLSGFIPAERVAHPCTNGSAWSYNGTESNEALGNATLRNTLPHHITYRGFGGTLPTPTSIRLALSEGLFMVRASFFGIPILCVYRPTATNGLVMGRTNLGAGGVVTEMRAEGRIRSETGGCPEGTFNAPTGDGIVTQQGNTNRISITLI